MRSGLGCGWHRKTASVILGAISADNSRDHEEHKRNASTAAVGELPPCVRLQRNMNRLFVWWGRYQWFLSVTSPPALALTQPALPTKTGDKQEDKVMRINVNKIVPAPKVCQRPHTKTLRL
jgi:hypothetical protein